MFVVSYDLLFAFEPVRLGAPYKVLYCGGSTREGYLFQVSDT